jgi:hypothetical protein
MQARVASLHTTPLVWDFDIQRLTHALSPSGHFTKHAASPCRSPSESAASWAVASGMVVAAIIQSTGKVMAILWSIKLRLYGKSINKDGARPLQPSIFKLRGGR